MDMNGLGGRVLQEKDLIGACLSRILVMVESKSERYCSREVGIVVCKSVARISLEKRVGSIDLKARVNFVVGGGR